MLHRPELGYYDEGQDFVAPTFYEKSLNTPGSARMLPPSAFRSRVFPLLEDEVIWAKDWICVGCEQQIPNTGDLLPFTVGVHGIHVQRASDGFEARFNKAQHGGCRIIPAQCQTGTKTRCSFTSCGYSRDRDVIPATDLGSDTPEMHQYLGLQPERLLKAQVATLHSLLFVNLDPSTAVPARSWDELGSFGFFDGEARTRRAGKWLEYDANWKLLGQHLTRGIPISASDDDGWIVTENSDGSPVVRAAWLFPNLVLMKAGDETCVIALQPTAVGRTMCRIGIYGPNPTSVEPWQVLIDRLAEGAVEAHRFISNWGTASQPESIGRELPYQADAVGLWMQEQIAKRASRSQAKHLATL